MNGTELQVAVPAFHLPTLTVLTPFSTLNRLRHSLPPWSMGVFTLQRKHERRLSSGPRHSHTNARARAATGRASSPLLPILKEKSFKPQNEEGHSTRSPLGRPPCCSTSSRRSSLSVTVSHTSPQIPQSLAVSATVGCRHLRSLDIPPKTCF